MHSTFYSTSDLVLIKWCKSFKEKKPLILNSDLGIKFIFYITVKFSTNYKNVNTDVSTEIY